MDSRSPFGDRESTYEKANKKAKLGWVYFLFFLWENVKKCREGGQWTYGRR